MVIRGEDARKDHITTLSEAAQVKDRLETGRGLRISNPVWTVCRR